MLVNDHDDVEHDHAYCGFDTALWHHGAWIRMLTKPTLLQSSKLVSTRSTRLLLPHRNSKVVEGGKTTPPPY